jgi:hypothetical protein
MRDEKKPRGDFLKSPLGWELGEIHPTLLESLLRYTDLNSIPFRKKPILPKLGQTS